MDSYIVFSFTNNKFEEFNDNINKVQEFYINNTDMNKSFNIFPEEIYMNENKYDNYEINNIKYNKNNFIKKYNVYIKKNNYSNNISECPICYNNIYLLNNKILDCKHFLCKYCYEKWNDKCIENNIKISCPLCRK